LQLKDIPRRDELQAFVDAASVNAATDYLKADYPAVDVVASSEPQAENMASNVIDGNLDTRWSANIDGDYIITDLGEVKKIGAIGICFHSGGARKTKLELHVSTDNKNWTQVCKGESSGKTDDYEYYVFEPMDVRYIRLTGHGNTDNEWNSINEISAFEGISADAPGKCGESYIYVDDIGIAKRYIAKAPEPMPQPAVTGHKHFWKADFTGHAKDDYLFTIRAASRRTIGGEVALGNNQRGHFMGDGATFIYRTCKEYDDIFAAWDWHKAPGTTVETKPFDDVEVYHSSESYRVNGVSDGNNGATAMELIHGGLSGKKAWFMFDDEVVALGADISLRGGKYSVLSTANQCLLKTDAVVGTADGKTAVITPNSHETQTPLWAIQDRIGYVFDGKSKVHITAKEQSGDRYDIDWNYATTRPNKTNIVTRDVFTVWFDHTADKTSTYQYTIVPNVNQEELKEYASANPVRVLSNTGKLQSVEHTVTGEKQAIFWTPGLANFDGISVKTNKEVIIAISGSGDEQRLAISSLSQKAEQVILDVTIDGVETEYVLDLPDERYTGSSLIVNLSTGAIEK
ncbi:MAG: discoidin domain-containing protein, partial [Clostridia bacterium]|nr:discoidin domain-containing protein [Clostridia bacterium]